MEPLRVLLERVLSLDQLRLLILNHNFKFLHVLLVLHHLDIGPQDLPTRVYVILEGVIPPTDLLQVALRILSNG